MNQAVLGNEVHIWTVDPNAIDAPELVSAYERLMTPAEHERQRRFHFQKDRHQFLVARALLRTTLSRYTGIDPRGWEFAANAYGRPEIVQPLGVERLRFSISHTEGLIACAVTRGGEVGVDVENLKRSGDYMEIAERVFSPFEIAQIYGLPKDRQYLRFFEYWTLKESYIKARGLGLSIPLNQFWFHLEEAKRIEITFSPEVEDDQARWQFEQWCPTPDHVMAIAIQKDKTPDLLISRFHAEPLTDTLPIRNAHRANDPGRNLRR